MAVTEQSRSPALPRRLSPLLTIASRTEGADTSVVAADARDVVIDLTALTFIDSATLRVFARLLTFS